MEVYLLGPVDAVAGGQSLDLGPRQQRLILAVLALEAGRRVSLDRLVELLWPDRTPPRSARNSVQVRVSGLRAALGEGVRLEARDGGYLLDLERDRVDAHRFRALVGEAAASALDERVRLLRDALALWRGPALAGVSADESLRERLAADLEESRLLAYEDLMEAELERGNAAAVLSELAELTTGHPHRERLTRARITGLAQLGEVSLATDTARAYRERLAGELGLDPSPGFQELELAVLRGEIQLPERKPIAPAQVLPAMADFTGRDQELLALDAALPLAVITGPGGVGKTALATQWAHRSAKRFPDGQLYVDLRGHSRETPLRSIEALGQLLLSVGVAAGDVPADLDSAVAIYRSRLAGRKLLVLLDNAASPEQVRPLLPGDAGSAAIVTSRDRMLGLLTLNGGKRVPLDPFAAGDATALVSRLVGQQRVDGEPEPLRELVRLCGGLPLALRIAAVQLADEEFRTVASYVEDLRVSPMRTLAIEGDERSSVEHVFGLSYLRLNASERTLFRLLSLVPGSDYTVSAAAAVLGEPVPSTRQLLRRLASAHLVQERRPGRYRQHDLLRHYAALLAEAEDDEGTRRAARHRLLTWYFQNAELAVADYPHVVSMRGVDAAGPVPPAEVDPGDPLCWFDAERDNLVAAVVHAADAGLGGWAWQLAWMLRIPFKARGTAADELLVADAAVRAAEAGGDPYGLALAHQVRAAAYDSLDHDTQLACLHQAVRFADQAGDAALAGALQCQLGSVYSVIGRRQLAYDYLLRGLATKEKVPDPGDLTSPLSNLGVAAMALGLFREAIGYFERARALCDSSGRVGRLPSILGNLSVPLKLVGNVDEAVAAAREATAIAARVGDRRRECFGHTQWAAALVAAGDGAGAMAQADQALELAAGLGRDQELAAALMTKGDAFLLSGDPEQAARAFAEALERADRLGNGLLRAGILAELADTEYRRGRHSLARDHCLEVLELTREGGVVDHARALIVLSQVELADGDPERALAYAQEAVELTERIGWARGVARARLALAQAQPSQPGTTRTSQVAGGPSSTTNAPNFSSFR